MTVALRTPRARRGVGLTPMIDVVFLLLVFFMLVSEFERPVTLDLVGARGGAEADVPRLVDIGPTALLLNGMPVDDAALAQELLQLGVSPESLIVLRPTGGATVQRLIDVAEALGDAGFSAITVIE